jgi:hypothetical protein
LASAVAEAVGLEISKFVSWGRNASLYDLVPPGLVNIEDALGVRDQANIPATIHEHPNWRRRLPVQLEDLKQEAGLTAVADVMASAGRTTRSARGA